MPGGTEPFEEDGWGGVGIGDGTKQIEGEGWGLEVVGRCGRCTVRFVSFFRQGSLFFEHVFPEFRSSSISEAFRLFRLGFPRSFVRRRSEADSISQRVFLPDQMPNVSSTGTRHPTLPYRLLNATRPKEVDEVRSRVPHSFFATTSDPRTSFSR